MQHSSDLVTRVPIFLLLLAVSCLAAFTVTTTAVAGPLDATVGPGASETASMSQAAELFGVESRAAEGIPKALPVEGYPASRYPEPYERVATEIYGVETGVRGLFRRAGTPLAVATVAYDLYRLGSTIGTSRDEFNAIQPGGQPGKYSLTTAGGERITLTAEQVGPYINTGFLADSADIVAAYDPMDGSGPGSIGLGLAQVYRGDLEVDGKPDLGLDQYLFAAAGQIIPDATGGKPMATYQDGSTKPALGFELGVKMSPPEAFILDLIVPNAVPQGVRAMQIEAQALNSAWNWVSSD